MTLGDMGADVIKVESPTGDEARHFGPPWIGGEGMNFMAINRNKRSVALDMKDEEGQRAASALCDTADIVIENFRPGVAERLGIGPDEIRARNPAAVVCRISGFGRRGPNRDRPALDLILQAAAGVMLRQGRGGPPSGIVLTIADCFAAQLAVQGILASLLARSRDGAGQLVEVSLYEAMLAAQNYRMISSAGDSIDSIELPASIDVAPYGAFESSDGWVIVAVVTDRSWRGLCGALDLDDLAADQRLATNGGRADHQEEVRDRVAAALRLRPTAELLDALDRAGVPCGPIKTEAELFFDEDVLANEMIVEIDHPTAGPVWQFGLPFSLSGTPLQISRPSPVLGEHTNEVLAELGYPESRQREMAERGASIQASPSVRQGQTG
jgi:formyl-CoA transferase/CoA:oxalate CoA-transferase